MNKKQRIISIAILLAMMLSFITLVPSSEVSAAFSGAGSGTAIDPYIITTVAQLQEMNDELDAYYELGNDIDASATSSWNGGAGFVPIGASGTEFEGHFDGNGYAIDRLFIYRPATDYIGLFGEAKGTNDANRIEISSVGLQNAHFVGKLYVGGLIGYAWYCDVSNCYVDGTVIGDGIVGGLIGNVGASVDISTCYTTGFVYSINYGGGLVGSVSSATVGIANSYSRNYVGITNDYAGGLIGAKGGGSVDNCYSTGLVECVVGGCQFMGGLIGSHTGGTTTNSFWDVTTSGQAASAKGTGKTTAQMKTEATFTDAGWNFGTVWLMLPYVNDGYPSLQWVETLTVVTHAATNVGGTSLMAQGEITATTEAVSRRGFVYMVGVAGDPDLGDEVEEEEGAFWTGTYSLGITDLIQGTTYRIRAFAENDFKGVVYGTTVSATTLDVPIVDTLEAEHYGWMDATEWRLRGYLDDEGEGVCEYRFQYGLESGTYTWETTWAGALNTGDSFSEDIDTFEGGETYYYRAQARNADGIGSGEEESFTIETGPPVVITMAASDITTTTATLNGYLANDGGATCEYRFQYGVNPGCYIYETTWLNTLETGEEFDQAITGLTTGTTYYFRAQAESLIGISSGEQLSFVAGEGLEEEVLSVKTIMPDDISGTYFVARGNILTAIPNASRRGFVYEQSTSGIPTLSDSVVDVSGDFSTGQYSLLIDGLTEGTHYRVRAFAQNPLTIAYGDTITVKTVGDVVIVTVAASNVALTTARLNSAVTDDGGQPVRVQFGWGTSSEAAIEDYDEYETLPGYYSTDNYPFLDVVDLVANTLYYFRVEASNDIATDLGGELTFTTGTSLTTPHNFIGYPYDTWISLHWAKGTATTNSLIRYSVLAYPTAVTEGGEVYLGANTSVIHEELTPGTTYYYSLWGESGGTYTGSYVTLMMTTHADVDITDAFVAPVTPSRLFSEPDYTNLSGLLFFYDGVNNSADSLGMPRGTLWMILAIVLSVGGAVLIYIASKGKMLIAGLALIAALVFWWVVLIVPFWIPLITIIMVIAISISRREVNY